MTLFLYAIVIRGSAQVEHNNLKTTKLSEVRLLGGRNNPTPILIKEMEYEE